MDNNFYDELNDCLDENEELVNQDFKYILNRDSIYSTKPDETSKNIEDCIDTDESSYQECQTDFSELPESYNLDLQSVHIERRYNLVIALLLTLLLTQKGKG